MKDIRPKNNADSAILDRIVSSALEECDYDIIDKTDVELLELAKSVSHSDVFYILNGYRQFGEHDVDDFIVYITNIIDQHSDYILFSIKKCYQVAMEKRKQFLERLSNNSHPSLPLPPDHIIF